MARDDGAAVAVGSSASPVVLRGVGRTFASPGGDVVALDDVSLTVGPATFTVVAGPSGSGKSTLLAITACIDRADRGEVLLTGVDVQRLRRPQRRAIRRRSLGIVLPAPADNLLDHQDALGNLRWCAARRGVAADGALLERVGLAGAGHKRIRQLSGGEQQRLALACALVGMPAVVLADEPTASLDRASGELVIAALRRAADAGATLLVASHDPHVVDAADAVVHLDHGKVVPS